MRQLSRSRLLTATERTFKKPALQIRTRRAILGAYAISTDTARRRAVGTVFLTVSTLRKKLNEIGLGRLAAAIQSQTQPSLRLTTGKVCAQAVSRLGGRPSLPREVPWPVSHEEQPLSFIAQLELATLPPVRGLPLPRDGSLYFFYDAVNLPWGFDPRDRGSAKVIYSASPLTAHRPRAPHRDLDEEARFRGLALTATPEISLPTTNSGLFREFHATREEFEAYLKLIDPLKGPIYRMGGHADEIQGDVCLEAQLVSNGIYCGDGGGYAQGLKRGLNRGAADWRLLLQVDSEQRTGMDWGDSGRIYFLIRKDDLRRRRFDNVWLILQCT